MGKKKSSKRNSSKIQDKEPKEENKNQQNSQMKKSQNNKQDEKANELKTDIGKGLFKVTWVLNLFIFIMPIASGYMMFNFENFSTGAWLWTVMISLYCFLTLLSQCIFPIQWEDRANILMAVLIFLFNSLFLYPGYKIYSGEAENDPSNERIAASFLMLVFGIFLTMTSNCQKYFTIKAIKAGNPEASILITEGMFTWTRNPNYLGDIISFFSFCNLANDCTSWGIYAGLLFIGMYPQMLK